MKALRLLPLLLLALSCQREEPPNAGRTPEEKGIAETETSAPVATSEPPRVGEKMPAYAAVRLDGSPYNIEEQSGKVTLVNIWATWCTPCRYEIPELKAMQSELSPKGFEVVGVSIDDIDSVSTVKSFVTEQQINYPIVLDPHGRLSTMFRTVAIPMTILLDREGTIVWTKYGIIRSNDPSLRDAIAKAL